MKIAIIINAERLTAELQTQLKNPQLIEKYSLTYDLFIEDPHNIETCINQIKSQSYNAFLIGGGDGTVRSAIQALIDTDKIVAILPLGTFNLLATSLNYPTNLEEILTVIKNGKTKQIDLVEVNGQIIINHAWIGFYFYILKLRQKHHAILGKNKLLKIFFNTLSLFKLLPIYNLKLKINEKEMHYQTCLVYIGNNEYGTSLLNIGDRKTLSSGLLSVTILLCKTRWELFLCMITLIFTDPKNNNYIQQFNTDELSISAKSNLINIVLDGELFKLDTPLNFINHHKKLTVAVP